MPNKDITPLETGFREIPIPAFHTVLWYLKPEVKMLMWDVLSMNLLSSGSAEREVFLKKMYLLSTRHLKGKTPARTRRRRTTKSI